jgi:hypothetical protein
MHGDATTNGRRGQSLNRRWNDARAPTPIPLSRQLAFIPFPALVRHDPALQGRRLTLNQVKPTFSTYV